MKMLNIIWEFRFILLLVLAAVFYCLFEWEKAKTTIYATMTQAKRYAKDQVLKNGRQQEEYVVRFVLHRLPLSLRLFIGEDTVRKIVRWLYKKLMDYMDDGILNESYKIE